MTQVTVKFYKPTGKLYTVEYFKTELEIFENNSLRQQAKLRFKMCDEFSYMIFASMEIPGDRQATNEFFTIVNETKNSHTAISVPIGSLVITPKEFQYFEKFGINLADFLKRIQSLMFNKPIA